MNELDSSSENKAQIAGMWNNVRFDFSLSPLSALGCQRMNWTPLCPIISFDLQNLQCLDFATQNLPFICESQTSIYFVNDFTPCAMLNEKLLCSTFP